MLVRERRLPTAQFVLIGFFGSQFPDLVDKLLAYMLVGDIRAHLNL